MTIDLLLHLAALPFPLPEPALIGLISVLVIMLARQRDR